MYAYEFEIHMKTMQMEARKSEKGRENETGTTLKTARTEPPPHVCPACVIKAECEWNRGGWPHVWGLVPYMRFGFSQNLIFSSSFGTQCLQFKPQFHAFQGRKLFKNILNFIFLTSIKDYNFINKTQVPLKRSKSGIESLSSNLRNSSSFLLNSQNSCKKTCVWHRSHEIMPCI